MAENYYSADCRFGGCSTCDEDRPPTRPVDGVVHLVCVCPCHTTLQRREADIRAAHHRQT